jgi:hypothetical protein
MRKRRKIMHESVKKILEFMSSQSEEIKEKAGKMSMAELSAFAKENGFELAVKEFAGKEEEGEIAIGEAEAAAGQARSKPTRTIIFSGGILPAAGCLRAGMSGAFWIL